MGCDGSKGHQAAQKQSGKDRNKAKHRAVPVHAIKAYGGYTYTSIFNSILDGVVSFISQPQYSWFPIGKIAFGTQ